MYIVVLGILFLIMIITPLIFKNIKISGLVTIFGSILVLGIVLKIIMLLQDGVLLVILMNFFILIV